MPRIQNEEPDRRVLQHRRLLLAWPTQACQLGNFDAADFRKYELRDEAVHASVATCVAKKHVRLLLEVSEGQP